MWRHNGNPEQDRLNAYWDAAVGGASPESFADTDPGLDPNLKDAIAQVRALHRRHRPDPAFALHLETTLMNAFATTYSKSTVIDPVQPKRLVTRPTWLPRREEIFPRKWSLAALATVALIAITLAAFFFTLRDTRQPGIVPGTPIPATPIPAPTIEPVTMYKGNLERTSVMPGPGPAGRPGVLWRVQAKDGAQSPVVVGDGLVFAGTNDGSVHAYDLATGAEVWSMTGTIAVASPSTVLDGSMLYVAGYDGMVLAVDAATGNEQWRTDPALNASRQVAFDADAKTLYVGGLDAVYYAFDSSTGALKWQAPISAAPSSLGMVVVSETLYFGTSDGLVYALNTADGTTRWQFNAQPGGVGSLAYADNTIYAPLRNDDDQKYALAAIDATTGAEKWRISATTPSGFATPAIVGGNLIFGTDTGQVRSVSAATGQDNWTFDPGTGAQIFSAPAVADGLAYSIDNDGVVYAIDASSGQEIWQVKLDGQINITPAVTGGVIYLGTAAGSVYALGDAGAELPEGTPIAVATPVATPAADATPVAAGSEPVELVWDATGGDGGMEQSFAAALAPDGTIWVADAMNQRFQIFDADGNFLESWGSGGTGDGQFNLLRGIDEGYGAVAFAPDGTFFVLDVGNHRVQVFAADRSFVRVIGGLGTEPGQFIDPTGIAVDLAGNVSVLDDARGGIQTFAPDGTLVATVRLQSTISGQGTMSTMSIDASGNFYVAEANDTTNIVEEFDPQGNLLQQFGLDPGPGQLNDQPVSTDVDAAGNVYITEVGGRILVFTPEGNYLTEFGGAQSSVTAFELPWGLGLDGQGNVYVTDSVQNRLVKLHLLPPLWPVQPAATPTP